MQFELAARLGGASFGVAAFLGLLATGLQHWQVLPLLFDAEKFERRLSEHEDEPEPWAPEDGAERTSYTILSNIAITWGFSLALHAGMLLYNRPVTVWQGVGLGVGGWVTFILSPCAGLSPELPGMAGAELRLRQDWWLGACVASALGIAVALSGGLVAHAAACKPGVATHAVWLATVLVGGLVLLAPHMAGAPHPAEGGDAEGGHDHRSLALAAAAVEGGYQGTAHRALDGHEEAAGPPLGMAAEFSVAVLLTTAVYWVLMGALCAGGFTLAMGYPAATQGSTTRMPTEVGLGDMPPDVARPVIVRLDVDKVSSEDAV